MDDLIEAATKDAINRGQLIEAGWIGMRMMSIPENAPQIQIDEMRTAFFAGAQHLFASLMVTLDPGKEPTDADIRRMDLIQSELSEFIKQYKTKHHLP